MQFQNMEKWEDSTSFLRGKYNLCEKDRNQNTSDFSQQYWKLENVFKIMKENYFQSIVLYLGKLSVKWDCRIRLFLDIQGLKKYLLPMHYFSESY